MTDFEIVEKAIIKAIDNGYLNTWSRTEGREYWKCIIFSHDFARAFFGDEPTICDDHGSLIPAREWELMQTVRKENKLKYLEKFLDV